MRAPRGHQFGEAIKERRDIVRAGAGFGMALKTVRRLIGARDALQRAVEQGAMRRRHVGRQRGFVHREAVILAADHDAVID